MAKEPTAETLARHDHLTKCGFKFEKDSPYTLILYVGLRDPYERPETILLLANELRNIAKMPPGIETLWGQDRFEITYDLADLEKVECPEDETAEDETGPVINQILFKVIEYLYSYFYNQGSELKDQQVVIYKPDEDWEKRAVVKVKRANSNFA